MICCGYIINDHRSGDLICEKCGKIQTNLDSDIALNLPLQRHDFIETVCANNHISKIIENEAISYYFKQRKKPDNNAYAAYCIYIACKTHDAARSLIEISKMCFVNINEIGHYNQGEINILPSDIAERALANLDIFDYTLIKSVKKLSDVIYHDLLRGSPPQSALAVAVFTLCDLKHLTQNRIAKACDTSSSCLRRLYRIYKQDIEKIKSIHLEQLNRPLFYNEPDFNYGKPGTA